MEECIICGENESEDIIQIGWFIDSVVFCEVCFNRMKNTIIEEYREEIDCKCK